MSDNRISILKAKYPNNTHDLAWFMKGYTRQMNNISKLVSDYSEILPIEFLKSFRDLSKQEIDTLEQVRYNIEAGIDNK